MKAIAAAAIASHSSLRDTVAAGGLVSAAVLLLSATGLLRRLTDFIPVPVVKGIQFGAGLSLIISAGSTLLRDLPWVADPFDNRLWALLAFLALVLTQKRPTRRFPYALVMFLLGLVLSLVAVVVGTTAHRGARLPSPALWRPRALLPAFASADAWSMAVAQLPLTTLNSVVAVASLAADLFPDYGRAPSVTAMGLSVGAMNLAGCWFGAMPVCHGAGGLAAQYRFGARSGASVALLGLSKVALGLAFGETLLDLMRCFPRAVLGVMVVAAGLELAAVGQSLNHGAPDLWEEALAADGAGGTGDAAAAAQRMVAGFKRHRDISDEERRERWTVMLMTTAGILAFKNDGVGFAAGMLCFWAYRLSDWLDRKTGGRLSAPESRPLLH
ncbi:uncharacterized protein E0L32_000033 [Thyridium curvatum]|uniref:Sulfate transporter n=1 Tax=Thyridium curvatum TaxID=1093900 RepID=A0A507BEJ2_9PEZI|nr:uncharacterized protein E0L32_000033 [Thyridium curvatum]TPX15699.1 hypothetical protein E0L32_000033 [Thyridium curvatum]